MDSDVARLRPCVQRVVRRMDKDPATFFAPMGESAADLAYIVAYVRGLTLRRTPRTTTDT